MSLTFRKLPGALLAATLALTTVLAAAESADTSNKWRLQVSGKATSDGLVIVRLSEIGGVAAEVPVAVPKRTDKKGIALRIRDGLNGALEADRYEVKMDDGEDVIVKAREDVKEFELAVVRNTADGTQVKVDRE